MLISILMLVLLPLLALAVVVRLDIPEESAAPGGGPTGLPWLDAWLSRVKPWHVGVALAVTLLVVATVGFENAWFTILALLLLLGLFARAWRHEFVILMAQTDDAFPGRRDKLFWFLLLTLAPPVGVGAFRAYRRAYRPETLAGVEGRLKPTPVRDWL